MLMPMSSAFDYNQYTIWGTNGTIEAYLESLCRLAAETPGTDAALRLWLEKERNHFFSGAVVFLGEVLADPTVAKQFLALFERATAEFLSGDEFTEYGKEWLRTAPHELHAHIIKAIN
jgi:hypothetical protein